MQRRKLGAGSNAIKHIRRYKHGIGKAFAAVNDAVPDSVNFVHAFNNAVIGIYQCVHRQLYAKVMVGHVDIDINRVFSFRSML